MPFLPPLSTNVIQVSFMKGGLLTDARLYFRMRAPVPTPLPTVGTPTGLNDILRTINSITVTWNKVVGALQYQASRSVSGSSASEEEVASVQDGPNKPTRTFSGLASGTKYDVQVRARGNGTTHSTAWGSWSSVLEVSTLSTPTPTPTPTPEPTPPTQPPLTLQSVSDKSATKDQPFSATLPPASGGTAPYTYTASGLPAGLSFTASNREVSGAPTTVGSSEVTYGVTDSASASVQRKFDINVVSTPTPTPPTPEPTPPLTLQSVSDKSATVGESFWATLPPASGGTAPYTYTASGLPAGLSFTASDRRVSGAPTTVGRSEVTYGVTDSASASAQQKFDINVVSTPVPPTPPTVTPTPAPTPAPAPSLRIDKTIPGTMSVYVEWKWSPAQLPNGVTVKELTIESKKSGLCPEDVSGCKVVSANLNDKAATTHLATGLKSNSIYSFTVKAKLNVGGKKVNVKSGTVSVTTHPMPKLVVVKRGRNKLHPRHSIPLANMDWRMFDYVTVKLKGDSKLYSTYVGSFEATIGTGLQVTLQGGSCKYPSPMKTRLESKYLKPLTTEFHLVRCGLGTGMSTLTFIAQEYRGGKYYDLGTYAQVLNVKQSWHQADNAVTYYVKGTSKGTGGAKATIRVMDDPVTGEEGMFRYVANAEEPDTALFTISNYFNAAKVWSDVGAKATITSATSSSTAGVVIEGYWDMDDKCGMSIACVIETVTPDSHIAKKQEMWIEDRPRWGGKYTRTWTDDFGKWSVDTDSYQYLPAVLVHELGHTLGFGESSGPLDIMGDAVRELTYCSRPLQPREPEKLCILSHNEERQLKAIYDRHDKHE